MVGHEPLIVACQVIHHPIQRRNMGIIVGAVDPLGVLLVPTSPCTPVEVFAVIPGRHLVRLIVEKALANAVLVFSIFVLQSAPDDAIDELLELVNLHLVGLNEFLHDGRDPGATTALIAEAGDPGATILHDNLLFLAIVGHYRWAAIDRIIGIDEPIRRSEEVAHVGNDLALGLGHEVVNGLYQAIVISDCQSRSSPLLAFYGIRGPSSSL